MKTNYRIIFDCSTMITYDYMHTVCGVVKDLWKCLWSLRDNVSVQRWEQKVNGNERYPEDKKPWELTPADVVHLQDAVDGVARQFPGSLGGGERLKGLLRVSKKTKSHTYGLLAGPIGMYFFWCMQDMPYELNESIIEVLRVMHLLGRKRIPVEELDKLEKVVALAVANAEFWIPASELDIKLHNVLHMVDKIRAAGPVGPTSMWVYESMWHNLGSQVAKRDTPEVTCLRRVSDQEAFLLHYSSHPDMYNLDEIDVLGKAAYWNPHALHRAHVNKELPLKHTPRQKTATNMTRTQKIGLHQCYLTTVPELRAMWNEYMNTLPGEGNRRFTPQQYEQHMKSFATWSPQSGNSDDPADLRRKNLRGLMYGKWTPCSTCSIGDAKFSTKPGHCYVVFMKQPDVEDLWVGQIKNIYSHMGPTGVGSKVVLEVFGWHVGVDNKTSHGTNIGFWDEDMKLPVVTKEFDREENHTANLVLSDQVAPLSELIVMQHPMEPERLVVFHKHIDFLEAAGFRYDINNPHTDGIEEQTLDEMRERAARRKAQAQGQESQGPRISARKRRRSAT